MNFENALAQSNPEERHRLIRSQIESQALEDYLTEDLTNGGWPDDACVESIEIEDDDERITATINISYVESVPSSCKDYNHEHPKNATLQIEIHIETASYEVEVLDNEELCDDDEYDPIYPGDYN